MKVLGIDEAGRGPVIGPMIITGVLIDETKTKKLKSLGVKDSKLLTSTKREHLYKIIKSITKHKTIIIKPKEIDNALESDDLNLNTLEAIKTIEIINTLNPDEAILDCPSPNIKAYKELIYNKVSKSTKIIAEHKADIKYIVVSAASIIAKSIREKEMEKIRKKYGDCGSGYPSDPKTQNFLKKHYKKHPEIFRHTWSTYQKVINKKKQKTLTDF